MDFTRKNEYTTTLSGQRIIGQIFTSLKDHYRQDAMILCDGGDG